MDNWKLFDTGLRSAAENIAFDKTLLELHQEGAIPNTLRFLQFTPSALIGFHQSVAQELHVSWCKSNNIEIQRRITGGGAIFFDETQLGWELFLDKETLGTPDMSRISRRVCETAARAISKLGIDARFRPRNDIEVNGRKISGTGGVFDGQSMMFQGTLLIDFDVEKMLRSLKIPAEKLSDKAIRSARDRVANLRELLGGLPDILQVKNLLTESFCREFGVKMDVLTELGVREQELFRTNLKEISSEDWVFQLNEPITEMPLLESIYRCAGGTIRCHVAYDRKRQLINQLWLYGDFFVTPKRVIPDLEARLRKTPYAHLEKNIVEFFKQQECDLMCLTAGDFVASIRHAIEPSSSHLCSNA